MENNNDPQTKQRDNDGLHKRRGVWEYSLFVDGKRKFFSTGTTDYQEARRVRAEAIAANLDNKLPADTAKWPFEKLLEKVKQDRELHLSENSIRIDRERSGPLIKVFGRKRVCDINIDAIRGYQRARRKQVGPKTINLETALLSAVMRDAKVWRRVEDDYKPLPVPKRGPGRALEPEHEALLLETAQSNPAWDAAFLAALLASNTTCRGCELKGLRLENVDLVDRKLIIGKSKTDAGYREIPLNGAGLWGCARLLERANALGSTEPEHFLFPGFNYKRTKAAEGSAGTGYNPLKPQRTWRTAWRSLRKEAAKRAAAGIEDEAARKKAAAAFAGLRFHDLRHTAITKLAESEASDQTIMSLAGHLDRAMLEHYSHIREQAKRKATDAIVTWMPQDRGVTPATKRVQ